jgi:hypothetical protein
MLFLRSDRSPSDNRLMMEYTVRVHGFFIIIILLLLSLCFPKCSVNTLYVPPIGFLKELQHHSQSEKIRIVNEQSKSRWH